MFTVDTEHELARLVQEAVPLVPEPYVALARRLGEPVDEVLRCLRRWMEQGKLREISGVLEGSALGYDSALVAAAVGPAEIDRIAAIVCAHPTVSHCYRREHRYDLWFTLAVPLWMGLERTLELLSAEAGAVPFVPLRRTTTFKIAVGFDPETRTNATTGAAPASEPASIDLDARAARILRALQTPLPVGPRPFARLASDVGVTERELLDFARAHLGGALRRYVATFRHRALGIRGNAMTCWRVPEARLEEVGHRMASAPEVSHCYARVAPESFPYRLYTMIHGPDRAACVDIASRLGRQAGLSDFLLLYSTHEYKKTRLRYFVPELDEWWTLRAEVAA
jgi:DNA-binding Lrp family transcriptional regulator